MHTAQESREPAIAAPRTVRADPVLASHCASDRPLLRAAHPGLGTPPLHVGGEERQPLPGSLSPPNLPGPEPGIHKNANVTRLPSIDRDDIVEVPAGLAWE